ncbi:MAG: DUF1232 domain-containing protein [Gemmatimonadota bacterium]|jgi:uncharacterized membrane protein YkvA (DUF1232 family)|nr:DUF1232 domain-containing protein [Gemmatimonadota bacterium]
MPSYPDDQVVDDSENGFDDDAPLQAPRLRRGVKRDASTAETARGLVRDMPNFARLLYRLVRDPRVSKLDKLLLGATLAYMVSPVDILPDSIPLIGQIDDIYLLALSLDRLLNNAGSDVLLDHWEGEMSSLEALMSLLDRAGSFLPEPIRMLLGQRGR